MASGSRHQHRTSTHNPATFALAITAAFVATDTHAQPDLAELPLEDLLNLSVSTASKLPSTITDSPGVISVYSAEEIALFGGRDLRDILARLPGISPFMASPGNGYRLTARGDAPRVDNNHILILLNGIPFNRESYSGGLWPYAVTTTIPLDVIRQIEVIRGPGSVLYGTNAFTSVINIITKSPDDLENRARLGAGDNNTQLANLSLGLDSDDGDSEAVIALRYRRTDGEPLQATDNNGPFDAQLGTRTPGALVSARHRGFHTTLHWGRADMEDIRGSHIAIAKGEVDNKRLFANLGYESQLSDNWLGKVDASHISARTALTEPTVGVLGPIDYKTDDSRLEVQLQGRFSDALQVVAGLTYDSLFARVDEPYTFLPGWRQYQYGAYSQLEYQLGSTRLIGGLQYNKAERVSGDLVPRMGIIHHINDSLGAKLIYAEAYRAPYAVETDVNITNPALTLTGNPDLEHETIKTWDFQIFFNQNRFQSALTFFHSKQENLIVRLPLSATEISFFNAQQLESEGVEFESKYIPHTNWYLSGSVTWQHNEDRSGTEGTTLQPDYFVKLGAGYRSDTWSLGIFDHYQSGYQDNIVVTPNRVDLNPSAKAIHNVSVNGTLRLPQFHDLRLGAYVHNALDEDIWLPAAPGFTTSLFNTLPGVESGRTFQLTAELPL